MKSKPLALELDRNLHRTLVSLSSRGRAYHYDWECLMIGVKWSRRSRPATYYPSYFHPTFTKSESCNMMLIDCLPMLCKLSRRTTSRVEETENEHNLNSRLDSFLGFVFLLYDNNFL